MVPGEARPRPSGRRSIGGEYTNRTRSATSRAAFGQLHRGAVGTIGANIAGHDSASVNASGATNLLTNGSFEAPVVPVGGFTNFNTGSTAITGWTVVGPQVSVVSGSYVSECCKFPASDGSQWLDLTGDTANSMEGVEQSVATVAGKSYDLTFDVGNVYDPRGVYGTTSTVAVLINGVSRGTSSIRAPPAQAR